MAQPTIDTSPGADTANSYCTRAEADTYHDVHLYADIWRATEAWKKDAALIWASRLLDEQVAWQGTKVSASQSMRWPRSGVSDADGYAFSSDAIPAWLANATAELARYLLTEDRTAERGYGLQSVKADVVEVVFDSADEKPILPASVRSMIAAYGSVQGGASGWVPLQRV